MMKGIKRMSLLWRESNQMSLQVRREERRMAKERPFVLTILEGAFIEKSCMRRTIDEMALLLKKHNISVPSSARKDDSKEVDEEYQRKGHALKA